MSSEVVEIGPRLAYATPFSTNAVAICNSIGLPVTRLEVSTRFSGSREKIETSYLDPMVQVVYDRILTTFDPGITPEPVRRIPILEHGADALVEANIRLGLGMDEWDVQFYSDMFREIGRNPADVEIFGIGNGNSEHSRHWFFRGIQVIDGIPMPLSLMEIVKAPWKLHPNNSRIAFHDNAGMIEGPQVTIFLPERPGQPSRYTTTLVRQNITLTAETHNHPVLIASRQGAETGIGGEKRDENAVGRGAIHPGANLAGYFAGNLWIPGHFIPGELIGGESVFGTQSPLEVLIEGSNGVSDYGNKLGVPVIGGFLRTFGQILNGQRYEARKPVLFCAGLNRALDMHTEKQPPEKGMLIVQIGGPMYRVGVGGGSASSMMHGTQDAKLDFASVQRGDAETENRTNRVIRTCTQMLDDNPIASIHDQGAGGPANVLTELVNPLGGKINIRQIVVGDTTMSVLEIWSAEAQERYGLLVRPEHIEALQMICRRERVNCEILGEITGDGRIVVEDSSDGTTPVDLSLENILGDLPPKTFYSDPQPKNLQPFVIPDGLTVDGALERVFLLPSVGSKGFLVHKVDRSVTGLVVQQQCCGPTQIPVADVGVTADSYFGNTGAATALGEQPIVMLVDPEKGARMAVAEMILNLCSAGITEIGDIKGRANWMWAAKLLGQGALLFDAAVAMSQFMIELGIAVDGGKDSLSMATKIGDEIVITPGELVITGYAPVPDIAKIVTPDLEGNACLGFISIGGHNHRLGGSALAQSFNQIGDDAPDIDDPVLLIGAFNAVQQLIRRDLITAYHDVSDGGLITTLAEMCMAGNRGAQIFLDPDVDELPVLFSQEAGMVFEFAPEAYAMISEVMERFGVPFEHIGITDENEGGSLLILKGNDLLVDRKITTLRQWWEKTSIALEHQQANPWTVVAEQDSHKIGKTLEYSLTFTPTPPSALLPFKPKVAVIREEGTNGDVEMAAAFYLAGFEPVDVTMSDLIDGRITSFDTFRGIAFCGGFSFADVFWSGKGWASSILLNKPVSEMFRRFYERPDTFSFGVCNGFQLMTHIGWLSPNVPESSRPKLVRNMSEKFESRWTGVRIPTSPSIMFKNMEGSVLGINVAHGEGQLIFPDQSVVQYISDNHLACLEYVDPYGLPTETYPYNPNGSPRGWAGYTTPDGRHTAIMPHTERSFLPWQMPWIPKELRGLKASPWLQAFYNAYEWCTRT